MILAIVGSVRLEGNQEAEWAISEFLEQHIVSKVVSGGAKGIDQMGIRLAKLSGIPTEEFLPEHPSWPFYKKRNIKIAEACDELLRVVSHKTKTYGSGWTRDYAAKLGKPTHEIVIYD